MAKGKKLNFVFKLRRSLREYPSLARLVKYYDNRYRRSNVTH